MTSLQASPTAAQAFAAARLAYFGTGNAEALVAQYAPDATVISPMGVLHGPAEIRPMIEGFIAEFAQPGVSFTLLSQAAEGDVAAFTWSAVTARNRYDLGAETYVLKDGKIACQTFAAKMNPL